MWHVALVRTSLTVARRAAGRLPSTVTRCWREAGRSRACDSTSPTKATRPPKYSPTRTLTTRVTGAPSNQHDRELYDYVVVGAGSAGCVLASRLTSHGHSVLLLEAGGVDTSMWLHLPVGYYKTTHDPRFDWCFKTDPVGGLGGRVLGWPRGKVLGGSSAINGLLHVRGQPEDYDGWAAEQGCDGWSFEEILPFFKRSEDQEGGDAALHGKGGPLSVSNARVRIPVVDAFVEGCGQAGIRAGTTGTGTGTGTGGKGHDLNGRSQEGAAYAQTTTRNGLRCSTATAYVSHAPHRCMPHMGATATLPHAVRVRAAVSLAVGVCVVAIWMLRPAPHVYVHVQRLTTCELSLWRACSCRRQMITLGRCQCRQTAPCPASRFRRRDAQMPLRPTATPGHTVWSTLRRARAPTLLPHMPATKSSWLPVQ